MRSPKTSTGSLRGLFLSLAIFFVAGSCTKNEIPYEDAVGVLTCRYQLPDGRVVDCVVDQVRQTIENNKDSLLYGTTNSLIGNIKLVITSTIGAEVTINGKKIVSGETAVDLTKPVTVETTYKGAKRTYQMKAFIETTDHSETSGAKVNTDMRMTGLPSFNAFSAVWFKDKLYILGAYYPGGTSAAGTAYYELYTSPDGTLWTKVNTTPNVIGGYGAELIVYKDKLYAIGGARLYGKDINGTNPEMSIAWRIMSSADGITWIDCTQGQVGNPSGRAFPEICVHDDTLMVRRGKTVGFGMWQNVNQSTLYKTGDGTTWTSITPNAVQPEGITPTNRTDDAMFSFDNKLWIVGGIASFISATGLLPNAYSSSDNGKNWVREAVDSTVLNIYGHRVITDGTKLYMIGGERFVNNVRVGVKEVFYSNDAAHWYPLSDTYQLPVAYETRLYPSLSLGTDNTIWILGGFVKSNGNYVVSGLTMEFRYDVWAKKLK